MDKSTDIQAAEEVYYDQLERLMDYRRKPKHKTHTPPRRRPILKYKHIGEVPKGMRIIVVPFVLEHGDKTFKVNAEVLFSTNKGFVKKLRTIDGELDALRYHYTPQELEDSGVFEVNLLSKNLEVDSPQ